MKDISLEKPAGVLVKTTCVDYPGMLAGSFFLKGCNLRCPYCYNSDLVKEGSSNQNLSSLNELFNHMEKRQGILKGIAISGGEPLLSPYTKIIIKKAKELGYKIKLDTNGTLPEKLEELLSDKVLIPDFIALDIKTSLSKYKSLICAGNSIYCKIDNFFEDSIGKSIRLLSSLSSESREFRTVLVPSLIGRDDIKNIASILPQNASWQFAQFKNENCLNPDFNKIIPYSDKEIQELVEYAQSFISGAQLR